MGKRKAAGCWDDLTGAVYKLIVPMLMNCYKNIIKQFCNFFLPLWCFKGDGALMFERRTLDWNHTKIVQIVYNVVRLNDLRKVEITYWKFILYIQKNFSNFFKF